MALTIRKRVFLVGKQEYPDPAPGQPLNRAIKLLQIEHPELINSEYSNSAEADRDVYDFNKKIGTYG